MITKNNTSSLTKAHYLLLLFCLLLWPGMLNANQIKQVAYIGFSTDKPFWYALGKSIQEAAEKSGILLVDLTPTEPDAIAQGRLIDHAIDRGVDGLIVGADNPYTLYGALTRAKEKRIPIVAVDTKIDHPAVIAFVATDNHKGALLAGEYIVKHTKGQGKVLILGGTPDHPNGEIRRNGVTSKAKEAGMTVIFRYADWKDEMAYKIAMEELRKSKEITAVFSCWDPGIDAASHVLDRLNMPSRPILVGFDGLPRTIDYIRQGRVTATIAQDTTAMARRSVELILQVLTGQKYQQELFITPILVDSHTFDDKR